MTVQHKRERKLALARPAAPPKAAAPAPAPAALPKPERTQPIHKLSLEAMRLAAEERGRAMETAEAHFQMRMATIVPEAEKLDDVKIKDGWGINLNTGEWEFRTPPSA